MLIAHEVNGRDRLVAEFPTTAGNVGDEAIATYREDSLMCLCDAFPQRWRLTWIRA